ncbi:MAG: Sec-independent protein translocase protein TatB [Pyrinomonadaceae bacterium]
MFLFIFESIGTSELILVGIVALIFLGPRRLPEIAKKIGKITAEFRGTANEFKETWKREVDFEEEAKVFDLNSLEAETEAGKPELPLAASTKPVESPTIKEVDASAFENLKPTEPDKIESPTEIANDKINWL